MRARRFEPAHIADFRTAAADSAENSKTSSRAAIVYMEGANDSDRNTVKDNTNYHNKYNLQFQWLTAISTS